MVIKCLVILALTGFATSLSPLERSLYHSVAEYRAGSLSAGLLDFEDDDVAPFLQDLALSDLPDPRAKHRTKRDIEAEGPMHYTELTVDNATKLTTLDIPEGVLSRTFVLQDKQEIWMLVGNQFYSVTKGQIQAATCEQCTIDYSAFIGGGDMEVAFTETMEHTFGGAFVVQAVLSDKSGDEYSRITFLLTEVLKVSGSLVTPITRDFQITSPSVPVTFNDTLSRITLMDGGEGRLFIASFQRNKNVQRADGLHLMLYDQGTQMFVPLSQSEFLLDNVLLRQWINDIKLIKIFDEERRFLVVARREETYIFEVDLYQFTMEVRLLQTFLVPDPVSIQLSADSIGTFFTLIESDGNLHSYAWDRVSFIPVAQYQIPGLVEYSWRTVELITTHALPRQALTVIVKDQEIQFLHNAMPGLLERTEDPAGLINIAEECAEHCAIVDLARHEGKDGSGTYDYFLLLANNGKLEYIELEMNPTDHILGEVNDVSICLLDLDSELRKDLKISQNMLVEHLFLLADLDLTSLQVDHLTVEGSTTISNLQLNLETEYSDIDDLNINDTESVLAVNSRKVDEADDTYILKHLVFTSGQTLSKTDVPNFSISCPEVRINSAAIDLLTVEEVGGVPLGDLLSNTLRLTGDQVFQGLMTFPNGLKSESVTVSPSATSTGAHAITVDKYFDKTVANVFEDEVKFSSVVFNQHASILSTINGISMGQIVTEAEMEGEEDIMIEGEKTFDSGFQAYTISATLLNEVDYANWKNTLLYKSLPVQEISVNLMSFQNITVNNEVTIDNLHGMNISEESLSDIVRTDEAAVITADCVFHISSSADDLITSSLNGFNPASLLIKNIDQNINVPVSAAEISATSIQSNNINGVDITTQAAKIDEHNAFLAAVNFQQEVIVSNTIHMDDDVTLAGMDPSEVVISKQTYTAPVTVTGILKIDASDVVATSLTIGDEVITTLTAEGLEDDFLVKDVPQTLPNLVNVMSDLTIKDLVAQSTIDDLYFSNVLHTSGDQIVDAQGLTFTETTFFEKDVQVRPFNSEFNYDQDAAIAGTKIHSLSSNVFCNQNPDDFLQMGSLIIQSDGGEHNKITSNFDVQVKEHFIIRKDGEEKDFLKFDETAALLRFTNQFQEQVDFTSDSVGLTTDDFTANKNINGGKLTTTLNGQILSDFDNAIVKKTGTYKIAGPVTFNHIQGDTYMVPDGGLFDGKNLDEQLDNHVLLDNSVSVQPSLQSTQVTVDKINIIPDGSDSYFSSKDLLTYINQDLLQKGDVITGDKTIVGSLRVDGDITVNSETNPNHPYGVDMTMLSENNLRLSIDQTITNQVEMNDLKVKKLYTNQVNGIEISNLNFIDGNVIVKMDGDGHAVVLENGAVFSLGIDIDGTLNGMSATQRNAMLMDPRALNSVSDLTVGGDVSWQTYRLEETTLSYLFDGAMVKSNLNWLDNTPQSYQMVHGETVFNDNVTVNHLSVGRGYINQGSSGVFDFLTVLQDSARKGAVNVFVASKTFNGPVEVSNSFSIDSLSTSAINGVNLADFAGKALYRTGSEQTIEESWTLANGFSVSGEAVLHDTVNDIQVGDMVYKSIIEETRAIPIISLAKGGSVTGDVVGAGGSFKTDLDTFLSSSIKVDENVDVNVELEFTASPSVGPITVNTLNGISYEDIILTGTDNEQTIAQALYLPQNELIIKGDLEVGIINTMDPTQFNTDALRVDRDESFVYPPINFQGQVTLNAENLTLTEAPEELDNLIPRLLSTLRGFTDALLDFYTENIIKPIRDVVTELYVAKHLGVGRPCYLEKLEMHESLKLDSDDFEVLAIDSLDFPEGGFMMCVEKGYSGDRCTLADTCQCKETSLVSGGDFRNYNLFEFTEKVFNFRLSSGFYTVTVKYDGSNENCTSADAAQIEVTGVKFDSAALLNLTATSVDHLGTVLGTTFLPGGYAVNSMQMWDLGTSLYIAIAPGYSTNVITENLLVYELAGAAWVPVNLVDKPANQIKQMILNSFKVNTADVETEIVHLLVIQEYDAPTDAKVDVYEWKYVPFDGSFLAEGTKTQSLSSPGITGMDILRVQPTKDTSPQVLLAMAVRFERFFNPTSYIEFVQYSAAAGMYKNAVMPDQFTEIGTMPITKIKARQISDTSALLVSTEEGIRVYSFLPNQGIKLVSEYSVRGKLVDMAVYNEKLPRVLSKEKSSTLIYLLTELWGVRRSELLTVKVEGKIDLPDVVFSTEELGGF